MKPEELVELVQKLNPEKEPGRLTLITRYGMHICLLNHFPCYLSQFINFFRQVKSSSLNTFPSTLLPLRLLAFPSCGAVTLVMVTPLSMTA
jgi:hypothetical protein